MPHLKFDVVGWYKGMLRIRDVEKMHQVAYGVYDLT